MNLQAAPMGQNWQQGNPVNPNQPQGFPPQGNAPTYQQQGNAPAYQPQQQQGSFGGPASGGPTAGQQFQQQGQRPDTGPKGKIYLAPNPNYQGPNTALKTGGVWLPLEFLNEIMTAMNNGQMETNGKGALGLRLRAVLYPGRDQGGENVTIYGKAESDRRRAMGQQMHANQQQQQGGWQQQPMNPSPQQWQGPQQQFHGGPM